MRKQFLPIGALAALLVVATSSPAAAQDLFDRVEVGARVEIDE